MAVLGFIGLGVMGREMASHLVAAGHTVQVFDVDPKAVEDLRLKGAKAATDVTEAARGADVVIMMLPDTPQVEAVIRQKGGLLSNPPAGRLVIDMSTVSPLATRRLCADLAAAGVDYEIDGMREESSLLYVAVGVELEVAVLREDGGFIID